MLILLLIIKMSLLDENKEIKNLLNDIIENIEQRGKHEILKAHPSIKNEDQVIISNYHCIFNSSEVAIILGENPHVSKTKALYEYLIKIPIFKRLIDRKNFKLGLNKEAKFVKDLIQKFKSELKQIALNVVEFGFEDTDKLNCFINSQIMNLNYTVPEEIRTDKLISIIQDQFKSEVNKFRGIELESISLDEIQLEKNIKITDRNLKQYEEWSKKKFYKIIGKVDGLSIIDNEKCVIEVKNRIAKRESVPMYDYIQCIMYMKLTKIKKCYMFECYCDGAKKETLIEWNEEVFKNIDMKLTQFVNFIRQITFKDLDNIIVKHQSEYVL
jgi:hypothetical protein